MQGVKNIYEVIQQKEQEFERVKTELHALRLVVPLLQEELTAGEVPVAAAPVSTSPPIPYERAPVAGALGAKSVWP